MTGNAMARDLPEVTVYSALFAAAPAIGLLSIIFLTYWQMVKTRNWIKIQGNITAKKNVNVGDGVGTHFEVEYDFDGVPYKSFNLSSNLVSENAAIGDAFPLLVNPILPSKCVGEPDKDDIFYSSAVFLDRFIGKIKNSNR